MTAEPETDARGMSFVSEVIDPAIDEFNIWFSDPSRGNGAVSGFEREILRSFLWFHLMEKGKSID